MYQETSVKHDSYLPEAGSVSDIGRGMSALAISIDTLGAEVNRIISRLTPIISDGPKVAKNLNSVPPATNGACEISRLLGEAVTRLRGIEAHVKDVIEDLAL